MSNPKILDAKRIISGFWSNPSNTFVIHYSRQNLTDNESGIATPRVIAIMVKSLDGARNECFAIHLEAEKANVILENIADYYDLLEERLLQSFNSFVKGNKNCMWIHWDMNDVHFSFESIKHRYCVLTDEGGWSDFEEISLQNRINLSILLRKVYGDNYEYEPVLENLMKSNNGGICKNDYLTLEDEARAFTKLEFPIILKSLVCKVNFLSEILSKTADNTLSVSFKGSKKSRLTSSLDEHPILSLIKNWTFWTVVVFVGGVAFSLGKHFGDAKFDKEKIDLYDANKILIIKNDSLVKQNTALLNENDSLKLVDSSK